MAIFYSASDAIDLALLGNDDYTKVEKMRLLKYAKYVYDDMNMQVIKEAKRGFFKINKRTNTVEMPENAYRLSSVNVFDGRRFWPVFRNDDSELHDDIVDVSAKKNCACQYQCGNSICNMVNGYVAVTSQVSDVMPNGTPVTFTAVNRLVSDRQGFVYMQTQAPLHVYTNGVWTNTILNTVNTTSCRCEVDSNGCILDTPENWNNICQVCGFPPPNQTPPVGYPFPATQSPPFLNPPVLPWPPPPSNVIPNVFQPANGPIPFGGDANSFCGSTTVNTWAYYSNSRADWLGVQCGLYNSMKNFRNIYNINEEGNKLIFPHNFGFDKVMLRWYENISAKDIKISIDEVSCFATGLLWWRYRHDPKNQNLEMKFGKDYADQKFGLLMERNKYRIQEQRMSLTPPVCIPAYWGRERGNRGMYDPSTPWNSSPYSQDYYY
jgi:hypothetical protein